MKLFLRFLYKISMDRKGDRLSDLRDKLFYGKYLRLVVEVFWGCYIFFSCLVN